MDRPKQRVQIGKREYPKPKFPDKGLPAPGDVLFVDRSGWRRPDDGHEWNAVCVGIDVTIGYDGDVKEVVTVEPRARGFRTTVPWPGEAW